METPAMHPDLAPIAFLIGTWRGEGTGTYPTIEPFSFGEEIHFTDVGKPLLAYEQRTWHPVKGFTMHLETGYWRPQPDGRIEIVLVHPTGIAEIQEGIVEGERIEVRSTSVARTSTAKQVDTLERTFEVDGDVLRYEVRMAAVGVPLTTHLTAELKRVGD